jgi:hypothetical protein
MKKISDSDFAAKVKQLPSEIEEIVRKTGSNYIEAVLHICERYNLEIEGMKPLLPKAIKEKIEADALDLNLLNYKINKVI